MKTITRNIEVGDNLSSKTIHLNNLTSLPISNAEENIIYVNDNNKIYVVSSVLSGIQLRIKENGQNTTLAKMDSSSPYTMTIYYTDYTISSSFGTVVSIDKSTTAKNTLYTKILVDIPSYIKVNNTDINNIYFNNTLINEIYLNNKRVW